MIEAVFKAAFFMQLSGQSVEKKDAFLLVVTPNAHEVRGSLNKHSAAVRAYRQARLLTTLFLVRPFNIGREHNC